MSKLFEGKMGTKRTLLGSGVWCLSCKCGFRGRTVLVLVVELAGVRAAARTRLACPGRRCWSKVFEEKTGTERTLLGSGVWCSSGKCGLWAREAHWSWLGWRQQLARSRHVLGGSAGRRCSKGRRARNARCLAVECGARQASVASGGALVVGLAVELAGARAAARTRLARPGRKCWSKVFEEKTGTERTLLGSGVWCSSCECGL